MGPDGAYHHEERGAPSEYGGQAELTDRHDHEEAADEERLLKVLRDDRRVDACGQHRRQLAHGQMGPETPSLAGGVRPMQAALEEAHGRPSSSASASEPPK